MLERIERDSMDAGFSAEIVEKGCTMPDFTFIYLYSETMKRVDYILFATTEYKDSGERETLSYEFLPPCRSRLDCSVNTVESR